MLFDTHTHPYITFKKSPETSLEHFFGDDEKNICVSIACERETSEKSIELAKKYPGKVFASIGFHPCDIPYMSLKPLLSSHNTSQDSLLCSHNTSLNSLLPGEMKLQRQNSSQFFSFQEKMELQIHELKEIYYHNKEYIVAVGETGLDYYHLASISEKSGLSTEQIQGIQEVYFRAQIALTRELKLPFVIHSRESNPEVLEILVQEKAQNYVFHCYSGDWEFAQKILDQNPQAMFGFGGTLTFKKSHALHEVARRLPLRNILLETDAPFLTPEPLRGKEENEAYFVLYVLKKLQELRDEDPVEIEKVVYDNAINFYKIKEK